MNQAKCFQSVFSLTGRSRTFLRVLSGQGACFWSVTLGKCARSARAPPQCPTPQERLPVPQEPSELGPMVHLAPWATYQNPPTALQLQNWAATSTFWLALFGWGCRWGPGRGSVTLVVQPQVHLFTYYPFNTPKLVYSVCFPSGNFWEQTRANK